MKISFHTVEDNLVLNTGYGHAGFKIVQSLQALGHEVPFNDPAAPVQISFCSPDQWEFHPGQYRIGYTPWESTRLPGGWVEKMNNVDEMWATSQWTADVYEAAGVKNVRVYEHGVDAMWQPVDRRPSGKVRFLHVGEPAVRKGGQLALDAFRDVFGDSEEVELTFKSYEKHRLMTWDSKGMRLPERAFNNVNVVLGSLPQKELLALYAEHDVLVYPSYGEGFGLIPLQALATGMPTICTGAWAPYRRYLSRLDLRSRLDHTPWPIHPGNIYYPDYTHLQELYRYCVRDIDDLRDQFYSQAPEVIKDFDWLTNTEKAFSHLVEGFTGN